MKLFSLERRQYRNKAAFTSASEKEAGRREK
jgi:hypothetical protein